MAIQSKNVAGSVADGEAISLGQHDGRRKNDDGVTAPLTFDQARRLTTEITNAVECVWAMLKKAHDGKAWAALAYPSWEEYVRREFQMSKVHSYRLLNYADLRDVLAESNPGVTPPAEKVARPLTSLSGNQQVEAWSVALQASGGKPTAKHIEAAVRQIKSEGEPKKTAPKVPRDIPADGMQYAERAIRNLEKIQPNDTQRMDAFGRVVAWLFAHRGQSLAEVTRFDELVEDARMRQFMGLTSASVKKGAA